MQMLKMRYKMNFQSNVAIFLKWKI